MLFLKNLSLLMQVNNNIKKIIFSNNNNKRCLHELKEIVAKKIPKEIEIVKKIRKENGKTKIGEVIVNQVYGGMRGIPAMYWETSLLDPEEGIRFRTYSIPECQEKLPKADCGEEAIPEGIFWLLLTGDIPTNKQVKALSKEWAERGNIPDYVTNMLNNLPCDVHPMTQFSCAVTLLNKESNFVKAFNSGVNKSKLWEYCYEDTIDLTAKVITIAAVIYRNSFKDGRLAAEINTDYDWSKNYSLMLGYDDPEFIDMMRMYLLIHCDQEGGNVSAHTTHLVGSALSDPYLAFGAGLSGLAGPLHGLANQEVLVWIEKMVEEIGDSPSDDQVKEFIQKTLKSGRVVPGYGHAVLRKTDPRFTCQRNFAERHFPDYPLNKIVQQLFKLVPPILTDLGKVQNPWPNVDAHSGVLLQYYGMTETLYYTVLFGVSRALGVLAHLIWARALGLPIERPKSVNNDAIQKLIAKAGGGKGASKGGKKDCPAKAKK